MTTQLDTSGAVGPFTTSGPAPAYYREWGDLNAFTQGYIEALMAEADALDLASRPRPRSRFDRPYGFSDLAPETLARIIADCEAFAAFAYKLGQKEVTAFVPTFSWGETFWKYRQADRWSAFPPQAVQLGGDGKIQFAKATSEPAQ